MAGKGSMPNVQLRGKTVTYTTAAPAISLNAGLVILDATAQGVAATLGAGSDGQIIRIVAAVVSGGLTKVTAASGINGGTIVTFSNPYEYVTLRSDGTQWYVIKGGTALNSSVVS